MGTVDERGIYFYEETDAVSPLHTLLNVGQQSVSDAIEDLGASTTRAWRFNRAAGPDSPFTTANTTLVSGTITDAPAGTYMIKARVSLYASGAQADGSIFARAGATTEYSRNAVPGDVLPRSPEVSFPYVHAGGNLSISGGYDRVTGTPIAIAGSTTVQAYYLGP